MTELATLKQRRSRSRSPSVSSGSGNSSSDSDSDSSVSDRRRRRRDRKRSRKRERRESSSVVTSPAAADTRPTSAQVATLFNQFFKSTGVSEGHRGRWVKGELRRYPGLARWWNGRGGIRLTEYATLLSDQVLVSCSYYIESLSSRNYVYQCVFFAFFGAVA